MKTPKQQSADPIRQEIRQLDTLGQLPSELEAEPERILQYETLYKALSKPITDDEARILVKIFGSDGCFGLASSILHLIETAPGWPLWEYLNRTDNEWINELRNRALRAGCKPLSPCPSAFETALITQTGSRVNNEDRANYETAHGVGCWVLADGLGGHEYGEVAAEIAVESILAAFRAQPACSPQALCKLLDTSQAALHQRQQAQPDWAGMRTTIVLLLADSTQACWAHAGDSRLYLFRGGVVFKRTHDHSVAQALVNSGEMEETALRHDPDRSRLLRDLGAPGPVRATFGQALALEPGDVFLLCTDGFWEPVLETMMEEALSPGIAMEAWLKRLSSVIEDLADLGQDNYTALAVRVG